MPTKTNVPTKVELMTQKDIISHRRKLRAAVLHVLGKKSTEIEYRYDKQTS